MAKNDIIHISHLYIERDCIILNDINWCVRKGENWCILAPNDSGETALLSILTDYTALSKGEVYLLGERYGNFEWRELKKQIGFVSSHISDKVLPSIKVIELLFSGKYTMMNNWFNQSEHEKRKAGTLLKKYQCEHLADKQWRQLSSGEKQQVMTARALMSQCKIIILDKPCTGLDPIARHQFLRYLQDMFSRKDAPSLIMLTHYIEEIIPQITHVMMMKKGRVFHQGKKMDVITSEMMSKLFDTSILCNYNKGMFNAEYFV